MLRSRLTYANVVATLALFIALGGTSVAASSLISGSKIKKASIPGDRLKKHTLTATQIDVAKLGAVPAASHATTADTAAHATAADSAGSAAVADTAASATHATAADTAGHASDADTLGGLAASAFTRSERFQVGTADSRSTTAQTLLDYPDINLRVETDGAADFDTSVIVHNTGTSTLQLVGDSGGGNIFAGQKATISEGNTGLDSQPDETLFLIQTNGRDEVLVDCHFPAAGNTTGIFTFCTGVRANR
ncbi:hypothetical protein OM076_09000 [Solirubrobacter ginsenosidimutans]|uniref:Uncharacterized protein n=1 Tax=Solirubrobacter ginsenosidimutans TaxID=490573 RepID=A0A9X3MPF9_9ACTN|nr:hypothetical protein [Solirubrobacter ginsenosidimutans]MDA0160401.1 hypothetical protein [Solirubrobacter ginsenosidimutans]